MRFLIILVVSIFVFIPAIGFSQTTWYVDGTNASGPWLGTQADPFQFIQEGIDAAFNGDTVLVLPFTYVENIDFLGKTITVTSVNGVDVTVIDGGNPANPDFGSVVIFQTAEGPDSILEGFTITNGKGTLHVGLGQYCGGGISCWTNCSPTLIKNLIVNNSVDHGGGGIFCFDNCSPDIIQCTVSGNSAIYGGGIGCRNNSSPAIKDCLVEGNTASQEGAGIIGSGSCSPHIEGCMIKDNSATVFGGGLEFYDNCAPIIRNNSIIGNEAVTNGGGGLIMSFYCSGVVENNIIAFNTAEGVGGGGLWIDRYSDTLVVNNTFYGNYAIIGGGVHVLQNSTPTFINNTICANTAKNNGGGMRINTDCKVVVTNSIFWGNQLSTGTLGPEIIIASASELTIDSSDAEGGQASVHVYPGSTLNWGAGMIDSDPLFVDEVNGDVHLTFNSPCRASGDNSAVTVPTDFEGDPRIAYGTVDMGADEFYTHLYWTGDATPGGNVEIKFVGLPGTSPVGLCIGTGVLDPPLKSMWGDWYLAFPIIGPMDLGPITSPEGVLIIPATIPGSPPAPYSLPMQALIGAELTNLCVLEVK